MHPRRTDESTSRPRQGADSATPTDRRPGVSFATKRGFFAQGKTLSSDTRRRASRKTPAAESSSTATGPACIPGTKSAIKRLAPITPPKVADRPIPPPSSPRSPTYKPDLAELGLTNPGPNARLFERIPIQDQIHNRKSFTSKADPTGVWQREPRPARSGELNIHPDSLQAKISDNFFAPPPAKKVARKVQNTVRPQMAAKTSAAKTKRGRGIAVKQPIQVPIEITDSSESDTHNDLYASDSGHSVRRLPMDEQAERPSDEIIVTLQNLSELSIQPGGPGARGNPRRSPFRRSQLKRSFLTRCKAEGIPIKGGKMRAPEITYVYRTIGSERTFETTVKHWGCPLCDTYSELETQQVLERHLADKDGGHPEVEVEMRRKGDYRWEVTLIMPDVTEEVEEVPDTSESEIVEIFPDSAARRQWKTFASQHRAGTVPMDVDEDGARTKPEPEDLALPSAEEIYDDLLDPSIRPPYLPFKSVEFSCRPNGPKLYDILGAKSLDEFGILAWSIIDREEELFEMDGVRDEDKVMQALWCRWIALNRRKHFIRNYSEGTKEFIRDNYKYIRRGAGWLALRAWLLVLHQTRFLKIEEVVDALQLYESLVETQ